MSETLHIKVQALSRPANLTWNYQSADCDAYCSLACSMAKLWHRRAIKFKKGGRPCIDTSRTWTKNSWRNLFKPFKMLGLNHSIQILLGKRNSQVMPTLVWAHMRVEMYTLFSQTWTCKCSKMNTTEFSKLQVANNFQALLPGINLHSQWQCKGHVRSNQASHWANTEDSFPDNSNWWGHMIWGATGWRLELNSRENAVSEEALDTIECLPTMEKLSEALDALP